MNFLASFHLYDWFSFLGGPSMLVFIILLHDFFSHFIQTA